MFIHHRIDLLGSLISRIRFAAGLLVTRPLPGRRLRPATSHELENLAVIHQEREAEATSTTERQNGFRPDGNVMRGRDEHGGVLIINADDWGRDQNNTDRIRECIACNSVSSVSAMVFMQDSQRAAEIAREHNIDAGLHLNLSQPFSGNCPPLLVEHQSKLNQYLRGHRFAQAVYHPGLRRSFQYVVKAQVEEFERLYGTPMSRLDGHHHMHLCANVLLENLIPDGVVVRRHFSFQPGEKGWGNLLYRRIGDYILDRRHPGVDHFFSIAPLEPQERLERIFAMARHFVVEAETHPVNADEYEYLTGGEFFRQVGDLPVARRFAVSRESSPTVRSSARQIPGRAGS